MLRVLNGEVITVLHRKHIVCVVSISVNEDPICTHQYKSRQLELARKFIFLCDSDFSGLLSLASHLPKVQLPLAFSDITHLFKDCLNEVPFITWDRRIEGLEGQGQSIFWDSIIISIPVLPGCNMCFPSVCAQRRWTL